MNNSLLSGTPCQIIVADLFAMINARRKLFLLDPVEQRAMASRCTLRFNLDRKRGVDFSNEKIAVEAQDMDMLEAVVNDQFGVNFDGELLNLCASNKKVKIEIPPMEEPIEQVIIESEPQKKSGFGSKIKRLFGGN